MNIEILVEPMKEWLGKDGIDFFRTVKENHGTVDAILSHMGMPHPIHFREGMSVRNKMREITEYEFSDHDYDNNWVKLIEECIKED